MARRKFTREFKVSAVKLVNEQGYTVPAAAKSLGVDPNCVRGWVGKFSKEPGLAPTGEGGDGGGVGAAAEGKRDAADRAGDFKKSGAVLCQGAVVKFEVHQRASGRVCGRDRLPGPGCQPGRVLRVVEAGAEHAVETAGRAGGQDRQDP